MPAIGVIGGSGFYDMPGLENIRDETIATPFGDPSDTIRIGSLDGVEVAFLPRHGRGHRIMPTAVNARASFWALKSLGVRSVWHESEEDVSAEMVIANLMANTSLSQRVVRRAVGQIPTDDSACECADALATAIITAPDAILPELAERHDLLVGKYLNGPAPD